ncbi:MAG: EAL domain-containing protein [Oscillibacter sp.]|nr:EAL domain-containing protein [Oscillibacter sp.]
MSDYPGVIANLLILLIFPVGYLSMPRLKNRQNRVFVGLLTLQIAAIPFNFAVGLAETHLSAWAFLPRVGYSLLSLLCTYWFFLFTVEVLRLKPEEAPWRRFSPLVLIASEVLTLTAAATGRAALMYALLSLFAVLYSAASLFLIFQFRERLSRYECISAAGSHLLLLAGNFLHIVFPSYMIVSTVNLMACIKFYLAFENPHLYMANRGNSFNMRAFRDVMGERIRKNSYRILAFALRDYIEMRGIYGGAQMDCGVSMIGRFLVKTYPEYQVFYLRSGRFVILGPETMDWEQVQREIYDRFQAPWIADDAELDLGVAFIEVEPATGLDSVDRILNYIFLAFENFGETLSNSRGLIDAESIRRIDRQVEIKRSLDRCLERNEVEIFLQPLIDSRSRTLAGAEVLCRIRDEDGNLISPAVFVPIAEQNGCINLMGEQVFEKACQFVRDHDMEQIGLSWLNVNLSPIQCMRKDLSERFTNILNQYGVSTDIIHLEITEQAVMDIARLEQQIDILRGIGFRFSLDDYGSGYSNLSRVKQYPFANIKLDMGIVWDYIRDKDVLLPTIVQAFKQMGFSVTAEGIEDGVMADTMSELGCDYLQGYYFSKPLPVEEFVSKYTLSA